MTTMTCCNTSYATVAETIGHRCPPTTRINPDWEKIEKMRAEKRAAVRAARATIAPDYDPAPVADPGSAERGWC